LQFPGVVIALVSLALGSGISALHLGHPERIFGGFSNFHSGITRELIAFVIIGIIMAFYLSATYRKAEISKVLAATAVLGSIAMVVVFADSYLMPARPVWNTVMLPLTYLASAAVLGLMSIYILAWSVQEEVDTVEMIGKATIVALVGQALVLIGYLVKIAFAPFPDPSRSVFRLLVGDLAWGFWLLVVALGLLAPYWLFTRNEIKAPANAVRIATTGLACAVAGGVAFRALLYVMGTTVFSF
jgi:anaerobic dimethyl sulfoxide reductase subunit C (anchor subunit)